MAEPDAVMPRIAQGIELGRRGDRGAARAAFREIWDEIGESGDALYRCSLAHSMADVQDDLNEELVWDLRALEAADAVTDERARRAGMVGPVRGWYPSLHLNLGDVYRRLGDLGKAREHLAHGRAAADALAHDGYGQMISAGLDRLAERLGPRRT